MAHSYFATSHSAHGFFYFSFWAPLGPFAFLKAHLCTLWAYEPLRLSSKLNGSSNHSLTLLPTIGPQNEHQQLQILIYTHTHTHTYMNWVQVIHGVTLSNVTPPNNLLLN